MLADHAAIEIVAAARVGPHQDRDGLALVELGDALRRAGRSESGGPCQCDRCDDDHALEVRHVDPPVTMRRARRFCGASHNRPVASTAARGPGRLAACDEQMLGLAQVRSTQPTHNGLL
jgi:hypothetical protein